MSDIFTDLNEEQAAAVKVIEGPVLVVAGPGTGKTQLLSARVANILRSTDTKPSNILCLTFTNKAAINMKRRVIDKVGSEGTRVVASTFHSFAAEIMNLYPDYFWSGANLSVAPESVQLDLVESIIKTLPLDNPLALKFAGQYTLLKDVQRSINLAKDAGLTPDKLRVIIEANMIYIDIIEEQLVDILAQKLSYKVLPDIAEQVNSLPQQEIDEFIKPLTSLSTVLAESLNQAIKKDEGTNKCTNTSKWKTRWVQTVNGSRAMFKERERNLWWLNLADVYGKYRDSLHQRGFYDYADMLVEVISQLEQNPAMLSDIQERFNYVLIDEFQDTTPAQLRLAHLVADHHSFDSKPNLMAVGDDDQSIFKFSGAELNNMLGFRRSYPTAQIIVLTKNYRSSQQLLDISKKIIEQAQSRLIDSDTTLDKNLAAQAPPKEAGTIKALSFASQELQMSEIARDIKSSYKPSRHIAVLARSHDSLVQMSSLLLQLKVPVRYEQASNILDHEIVNQVYLISKLVLAIQNGDIDQASSTIHKVVRWPIWALDPKALWQLATANYPNKDWLTSLLNSSDAGIKNLGKWFMWLSSHTSDQQLAVTIEQILGLRESDKFTSPIRDNLANSKQDTNHYFHGISAVQLLRSLVHEFGEEQEPTLIDLVRFIEINKQNGIVIADESPFITGARAVELLTVHKAKGLEFDHVYIVDAIEENWKPRAGGRKPPANLPLQPPGDDFDDYVRLMYVAATRAKSSLTISAYHQDHSGRQIAQSSIVQAALKINNVEVSDETRLIEVLEENLRWPQLSGGEEKKMLQARLESYNLAVTHLLNFLDVTRGGPQYFKERNLLYLPEAKTASLSYGTAMHSAMDEAQKLANKGSLMLNPVIKSFELALQKEQMPKADFERYLSKGKQTLSKVFDGFNYEVPRESLSEQNIKDIMVGKAVIGGKLDRIDISSDEITIVDYKTGAPVTSFTTSDKNKALKAYKHKMQLIFYALLAQNQPSYEKSQKIIGKMVYLDAEKATDLERLYEPTAEDIQKLTKLIQVVWTKIMNLDLPDTNHYSADIDGVIQFENDLLNEKTSD